MLRLTSGAAFMSLPASCVSLKKLSLVLGACMLSHTASAQEHPFSFEAVEFMPLEQREPAVQAFLAHRVTPGMPIEQARRVLRHAGAFCSPLEGETLRCMHSSMQRHPGESLQDVTWQVTVLADGAGLVQTVHATRSVAGA